MRDMKELVLPVSWADRELAIATAEVHLGKNGILKTHLSDQGKVIPN